MKRRNFGDFYIDCLSRQELVDICVSDTASKLKPKLVIDVNGHAISAARSDVEYRKSLSAADIVHADGGFLVTLSKIFPGNSIPERSATTDFIHDVAKKFETTGQTFFLFGADENNNKLCAETLKSMYPNLNICGRRNGYFSDEELPEIIEDINSLSPDVIWLGLGKPREQLIGSILKGHLNQGWVVTCGGCFNYISGHYKRAPMFLQKLNLEWLFRLSMEPKRLFWRYTVTSPHALYVVLKSCFNEIYRKA